MLSMDRMKLNKVLKKDIEKYLGIIPDKRRNDFKQFIAENGGYNNAIETLKSKLEQLENFKQKKEVRQKQIKKQNEYIERKRNDERAGKFFNKIITLNKKNYSKKPIELKSVATRISVLKQLQEKNALKKPFKITMTDYQTGIDAGFTFRSVKHFNNWLEKMIDSTETKFNYGTESRNTEKTLFQLGTVKVELLRGGYQNKKAKQTVITLSNGSKLNCFNPISQRNN